jgi:hypothetical protein
MQKKDNDVVLDEAPEVEVTRDVDPRAGWVWVEAQESLAGGDKIVARGERYQQPPEAAEFMAAQGWVKMVDGP